MAKRTPESASGQEGESSREIDERDIIPFQEQKDQAFENLSGKYIKESEISDTSKKVVGDFLAKDMEEGYKTFAVAWFEKHKDEIREELKDRGITMREYSDDEKFGFITTKKSEGGMGVKPEEEIRKEPEDGEEDYRWIGKRMDQIGVLRNDMAKKNPPPETPFLILNYLQENLGQKEKDLVELKRKAERGDASAEMEAASKEKELAALHLAQREIVEKTMHENLNERAENELKKGGFPTRENYVDKNIEAKATMLEGGSNALLMAREWTDFQKLSEKERREWQDKLAPRGKLKKWVENKEDFESFLLFMGKENGIEEDDFYGLLQQGYKPHEAKSKFSLLGIFTLKMSRTEIPNKQGKSYISDGTEEGLQKFVNDAGKQYKENITKDAKDRLGNEWDQSHDQKVQASINERIAELAKSPEAADGGIEELYKNARERIVGEYIKKQAEKNPKTAEQLKTLEKEFEEDEKDINVGDFIGDTHYRRGGLEKLRADWQYWNRDKKVMEKYLSERLGVDVQPEVMKKITMDRYYKAWETQTGLFILFMELISESREMAANKRKKSKKKAA